MAKRELPVFLSNFGNGLLAIVWFMGDNEDSSIGTIEVAASYVGACLASVVVIFGGNFGVAIFSAASITYCIN